MLSLIYPYFQYEGKKFPVPLSMLNYNYTDRRGHLMAINWFIFMRLTHLYIYIYMCIYIYACVKNLIWHLSMRVYIYIYINCQCESHICHLTFCIYIDIYMYLYISVINAKWWASFRVILIITPLLIGAANMHHHTSLMFRHVITKIFCAYHIYFIFILMCFS